MMVISRMKLEGNFITLYQNMKRQNIFFQQKVVYKIRDDKILLQFVFREGVKKKQKKSCNIVTTPVRLPTYPYCCTEGNFSVAIAT